MFDIDKCWDLGDAFISSQSKFRVLCRNVTTIQQTGGKVEFECKRRAFTSAPSLGLAFDVPIPRCRAQALNATPRLPNKSYTNQVHFFILFNRHLTYYKIIPQELLIATTRDLLRLNFSTCIGDAPYLNLWRHFIHSFALQ
jgi:hypothetical protein